MKSKAIKTLIVLVVGMFTFISCNETLQEINQDPNAFNTTSPENQMAGVVKNSLDIIGGDLNFQMYLNYGLYIGGVGGQFPRYFWTETNLNSWWNRLYVGVLKNTQEIIDTYGEDPEYTNRVHIAKIWKSYVYSVMVSTFGSVPLTEALGEATSVKYDSEEVVYTEILNMLKDAGDNITMDGDKLLQDVVFGGDNGKWVKFANTLRLKIALRISAGFPQLAETHVREVMANEAGLISSQGENALMSWGAIEENWSYYYRRFVFSGTSLQYPKINHYFMLMLKTYDDPRVSAFAEPSIEKYQFVDSLADASGSTNKVAVTYAIPYVGKPLANSVTLDDWDFQGDDNPLNGLDDATYSNLNEQNFLQADIDFMIISLAETNFMKAEAALKGWGGSKSAEAYYYDGIDASFAQYGVGGAAAYKEMDGVKWGTTNDGDRNFCGIVSSGISDDPMTKIVNQRWVAMFFQGHDAWCLQKRTRILDFPPHLNPEQTLEMDYSDIPERMRYPTNEEFTNGTAYAEAVAGLGGSDNMVSPLKMNKPYTPVAWENYPAELNFEFASEWFGPSVDDLKAAGMTEVFLTSTDPDVIEQELAMIQAGEAYYVATE